MNQNQKEIKTVFDVMVVEENRGNTYWNRIGVAWPLSTGEIGFTMKLNMFPELRIVVKESVRAVGMARVAAQKATGDPEETPF